MHPFITELKASVHATNAVNYFVSISAAVISNYHSIIFLRMLETNSPKFIFVLQLLEVLVLAFLMLICPHFLTENLLF